jgi:hypothetical protein
MGGVEAQRRALNEAVANLASVVRGVSEEAFLGPLGRWSARDIVAHLIGWNRYTIRGAGQIARGELPFYDVDPGVDFANVNRQHVANYPSRVREDLLAELNASARELSDALSRLDEDSWSRDYGVRHDGRPVTIRSTVDDLIADYAHHAEQILGVS